MLRRKKSCLKKNFTLIELLVSLAVFSILLLIMLQFFSGAQRLWVASENRNNVSADARVALQVIGDLLSKAYWTSAVDGNSTDFPFKVDYSANDSKIYFITDSLYKFKASDTSDLYFVAIYRTKYNDPDTNAVADQLRIRAVGGGTGLATYLDGTNKISWMCDEIDKLKVTQSDYNKLLVSGVLGFEVTARDKSGNPVSYGYPYIINITLRMLSPEDYQKWKDLCGGGSETTEAKTFRELVQLTFTKTVFLGEKKYDL